MLSWKSFSYKNYPITDVKDVTFMMEKLGQPKNLLEVKKMIAEVDTNNSGTINYNEFIEMMLGKKNSVLKM